MVSFRVRFMREVHRPRENKPVLSVGGDFEFEIMFKTFRRIESALTLANQWSKFIFNPAVSSCRIAIIQLRNRQLILIGQQARINIGRVHVIAVTDIIFAWIVIT